MAEQSVHNGPAFNIVNPVNAGDGAINSNPELWLKFIVDPCSPIIFIFDVISKGGSI